MSLPDQMSKTFSQVNEKNPFYVMGGILLILLVADYFGIMQFQLKTLISLTSKIADITLELETTKNNIQRMPQYQKETQQLEIQKEDVGLKIKSRKEVPRILENISRVANAHGVRIEQIMPNTSGERILLKDESGQYIAVPINVDARSGYHNFARFLNQLETEGSFLDITHFTIMGTDSESRLQLIKLTLNATVVDKPK